MLITKTPLRISFLGGGSDIPEFYNNYSGLTLSTTINKYIYIALNNCDNPHLKVVYSKLELVDNVDDIENEIVRNCLKVMNVNSHFEMASFSDITGEGSGLGSSSAFTVGLLNGLDTHFYNYKDPHFATKELAEAACYIEINKCGHPIGKQDQYAAAYGGFNLIHYSKNKVEVEPMYRIGPNNGIHELEKNLFLFNTGITRRSSLLLKNQRDRLVEDNEEIVYKTKLMVEMAKTGAYYLENGRVDDFGDLLNTAWCTKKTMNVNTTNPIIDEMYETALASGAIGGKLCGAGGGGYLLIYCPQKYHSSLLENMKGYDRLAFRFSRKGSTFGV